MEKIKKIILKVPFSIFIYRTLKKTINFPGYIRDIIVYSSKQKNRFPIRWTSLLPYLEDKTPRTNFEPHYIYHPAWAMRVISKINPTKHIDISSTISFGAALSAFIPVDFYDYRPAEINLSNLNSLKGDLLSLPFKDNSVESISCMHTVEHVGLGRYGDPIDPDGDIKAINELKRVTKVGGNLIFVSPIGKPKLEFNAHRIYSYDQVIKYFEGMQMVEFSLVPDDYRKRGFIINASKTDADSQTWGCGCFWFKKIK